jgi:hypothetical protein
MSAPSTTTVVVAVGELRADARRWSQAAGEHAALAGWMSSSSFPRLEFGPIARLQDDFERARVLMEVAVTNGGRAAETVSLTLSAAAAAYLMDEIENVHALEQIW